MKDEDIDNMTFRGIKVEIIRKVLREVVEEWLEKHKDDFKNTDEANGKE